MAATPVFSPTDVKRLCGHMNEGHLDAVQYYVQYYGKRPAPDSCKMVAFDEEWMDIDCIFDGRSETVRIKFDHKLKDADDARMTLIDMMWKAVEGLGMSRHTVRTYVPDFPQAVLAGLCLLNFWTFLTPKPLTSFEIFFRQYTPPILQYILLAIPPVVHALETIFVMNPLLKRHRTSGKVKRYWQVAVLATGYPSIRRYKLEVEKQVDKDAAQRKEGKKH